MNWTFYSDEPNHYSCTRTLQDIMNVEVVVVKHEKDNSIADDVRNAEFLHTVVFLRDYSIQDLIDIIREYGNEDHVAVLEKYADHKISDEKMHQWWIDYQHNEEIAAIIAERMTGRQMPAVIADGMAHNIIHMEDDDEDSLITYSLYQLNLEKDINLIAPRLSLPYNSLAKHGLQFDSSLYECVYVGKMTQNDTLDDIFELLNRDTKPNGYIGRSMSVSDILVIHRPQGTTSYYVNPLGYVPVEFAEPSCEDCDVDFF